MTGFTHLVAGVGSTVAIYVNHPEWVKNFNEIGVFLGSFLGSLFPDIDSPTSKISTLVRNPFFGIFFSHRGFWHSLSAVIIVDFLFTFLLRFLMNIDFNFFVSFIIFFTMCYLLHIFFDMIGNKGVKLFYPFSKRSFSFPLTGWFKSRTPLEFLILLVYLLIVFEGLR
ncbi:inner membrane protein [Thermodesulfobium acidiphilum]|uniref:Inner membrane protein n=1 Tax=Thermodesulfobium acidiphilum TaxID=1794699 RepID=A0A2R4W1U3_THEAF|nr:metal-dependent hydrolase [Thermodesulfobium acidiphilum]AWB10672.1 inner membrane protein [Thermodesulfobium acidiphilum]